MATHFDHPSELINSVGLNLGCSDWMVMNQERINLFANATDDHQWIHVDEKRAKTGEFGKCIAHGYLSLSLVSKFLPELISVERVSMGINYGCNKVRFPAPVLVDSRIRANGEILSAENVNGAVQTIINIVIEIEGSDKPACVAEVISRFYPE